MALTLRATYYSAVSALEVFQNRSDSVVKVFWKVILKIALDTFNFKKTIGLETKSCRILPLTYGMKYDMT